MAIPAEEFIPLKKQHLLGRHLKTKDVGRAGTEVWECEAVTMVVQSNHPEKVFSVERLRLVRVEGTRLHPGGPQVDAREYRFGYWIVSRRDRWWWGQYAPFIPQQDLAALLDNAREDGTILPEVM